MFIGYPNGGYLGASLAVSHLLVAGWLLMKGFPYRELGEALKTEPTN